MAGLQTFLGRTTGRESSPTGDGHLMRDDRVGAQSLKFSSREASRRSFAARKSTNTQPETQYRPHSYPTATASVDRARSYHAKERLEDSSIHSDFDQTLSETHFNQRLDAVESVQGDEGLLSERGGSSDDDLELPEGSGSEELQEAYPGTYYKAATRELRSEGYTTEPEQPVPPHALRRKGGSPNARRQQSASRQPASSSSSGISGRFAQSQNVPIRQQDHVHNEQHVPIRLQEHVHNEHNVPIRQQEHVQNEHNVPIHRQEHIHNQSQQKKRPHTPEPPPTGRPQDQNLRSQQTNPFVAVSSSEADDISKLASPDRTPRRATQPRGSQYMPSEPDTPDGAQTEPPRIPLDHDYEKLKTMTFAELYAESWEFGHDRTADDRPLPERLQEIMSQTVSGQANPHTIDFFAKMSTDEWEESGEWFVDRFAEIMQAMSAKRKQRRIVTAKYEKELMERERAVRGKSDDLDKKFKDMRASGEDLLKGKY